ncbi:MAG: HNH endonuclease [Cyanobacteria bacterium J06626_18]
MRPPVHTVQQTQQVVQKTVDQGHETLANTLDSLKAAGEATQQTAQELTDSGCEKLQDLHSEIHTQSQQSLESISRALESWQAAIAGLGTSGMVTANALQDLPRTAQELAQEMPKLTRRLQTAGIRVGDAPRTDADIMGLFNKIPGTSKLGANEWDIRVFLSDKHGSHIRPHAHGGSNGAKNILWEVGADNIRRGAKAMTGSEQLYIRFYNAVDSILKNSMTIAQLGLAATSTAVLTQAIVTALSYTLDLYRGDITIEEFKDKIMAAAVSAGITTPIFFLIFIAVIALFPETVAVLSAPAVVVGFNALFGVGIALPIIQSVIRHVEAEGFGSEVKVQYQAAIAQGEALLKTSSQEVQQWWEQFFAGALSMDSSPSPEAA